MRNAWHELGVEQTCRIGLRPDLRVTSSLVEEFAQGHTASDVLRELVQNEYDAGGRSLSVTFGEVGLDVRGTGA